MVHPPYLPVENLIEVSANLKGDLYRGIHKKKKDGRLTIPRKVISLEVAQFIEGMFEKSLMDFGQLGRIYVLPESRKIDRGGTKIKLTHIVIKGTKGFSLYLAHLPTGYTTLCRKHVYNEKEILREQEDALGIGIIN